tara:strand:- start:272 stop:508 length:237 start_codon:yes stop_codon:yes gene_type:complete
MFENVWDSSSSAARKLGIKESQLSELREFPFFKPGIHWRSSPFGQLKPWSPDAIYNVSACEKIIYKYDLFNKLNKFAA